MVKVKPILFSTEMVQAILDDRKSETRRVVKPQPVGSWQPIDNRIWDESGNVINCPYGGPGDMLWIRETFTIYDLRPNNPPYEVQYKAGGNKILRGYEVDTDRYEGKWGDKWIPGIFMPTFAARVPYLSFEYLRVEKLQEMSQRSAELEGMPPDLLQGNSRIATFRDYWDKLNAKRGFGWEENPIVWVIGFKK